MRRHTRGDSAIYWIEKFCCHPDGHRKGQPVRLTPQECWLVRSIYDDPGGPQAMPVTGELAGYLALLHVCGHEALQKDFHPNVRVDCWTIWRATSEQLQDVLKREGEAVVCPKLGTRWPVAA